MSTPERLRKTRELWDPQAGTYDEQFDHDIGSREEGAAWERIFTTVTGDRGNLRVLDIGTGTGFLALRLASQGHQVTAIDLSPEMLDLARAKAEGQDLNVRFEIGDAEDPPFPEQSFDLIISRHVFWSMSDPDQTLRNWYHLLRPEGTLAILDGDWCTPAPDDPDSPRLPTSNEVAARVQDHGFINVQADDLQDLRSSLNERARRDGRPIDHFQRYLVWAYRAA